MIFTIDTLGAKPETKRAVEQAPPIDPRELEELGRMRAKLPDVVDEVDDDEAMP